MMVIVLDFAAVVLARRNPGQSIMVASPRYMLEVVALQTIVFSDKLHQASHIAMLA
jgi:hypothetical protein